MAINDFEEISCINVHMGKWDDYRVFLAVARTGTLSQAAQQLGISQPTAGRRIAALERALDARLFERAGRQMALTAAGVSVQHEAEIMERAAASVGLRTLGIDRRPAGTVRLSVTEGLGSAWITPRLAPLLERYPGLKLEIATDRIAANLSKREADIAVRFFRPAQSDLLIRRFGDLRYGLFAARAYLKACGTPRAPADLAAHRLIGFEDEMRDWPEMAFLYRHGLAERFVYRSNSAIAQLAAAEAGLGIAPLPVYLAAPRPALARVMEPVYLPGRQIWLAVHKDIRRTARVAVLWDFLAEILTMLGRAEGTAAPRRPRHES